MGQEDIAERNWRFLLTARKRDVRQVGIIIEDEACPSCRALILSYAIDQLPPLPDANCTRPGGCECWYVALPST